MTGRAGMADYWSARLTEAVWLSFTAPTPELRQVHLLTAAHYRSLLRVCAPDGCSVHADRLAA